MGAISTAGIDQLDWHLGQILCPFASEASQDQVPDVVLIDFAFTRLRLGDRISDSPKGYILNVAMLLTLECDLDVRFVADNWPGSTEDAR